MKRPRSATIGLALILAGCTPWDRYVAGESQKYSGEQIFTMHTEWGRPVSRTLYPNGSRFYQFRKPGTDCTAAAWADPFDIIVRLAVSGPETCAGA